MKKLIALCVMASMFSGCLWVCRVPFPTHEEFSDEGECTNRVWKSMITECREKSDNKCFDHYYPTIYMRVEVTGEYMKPIEDNVKGKDLYQQKWFKRLGWIPLGIVWLTSPIDAVVDTLMIPYDYTQLD